MQQEEIKKVLARKLRRQDIDNLWSYLVEGRYVKEVLTGYMTVDELVETARKILTAGQPSRPKVETASPAGPAPGEARAWALSMLIAAEAERDDAVIRFRNEVLHGVTMARSEVAGWIEHHPEAKLPMTHDVTITVEAGQLESDGPGWARLAQALDRVRITQTSVRVLDYAGAEDNWVSRVAVRDGGQLDWLRRLAEALAKQYCWQPAQATLFVLTGAVPLISRIRMTTGSRSQGPWADRVVLDVDPAESPAKVATAFAAQVRAGRPHSRPVKEKHARLAVHALVEHATLPWKDRTRLWNAEHSEWQCSDANYRRDALDTRNRLLRIHNVGGRGLGSTT